MRFDDYSHSLTMDEKRAFAERAGTSHNYCYMHLCAPLERRKGVSIDMLQRLTKASEGAVSTTEMLEYFGEVK